MVSPFPPNVDVALFQIPKVEAEEDIDFSVTAETVLNVPIHCETVTGTPFE